MSRIEGLVIALGLLLIVFGLAISEFQTAPRDGIENTSAAGTDATSEGVGASTGARHAEGNPARRAAPRPETGAPQPAPPAEPSIALKLRYASDGAPAPGIDVELWRRATGEGAGFRSARRLTSGRKTDARGALSLNAPAGYELDLFCRASAEFPPVRIEISPLEPGERRPLDRAISRPPAALSIELLDATTERPIAGASIRAVTRADERIEDFPGTNRLLARTDADGECELKGTARLAPWILIDASGYAPTAIRPLDIASEPKIQHTLERAAKIEVTVVDEGGTPAADCEVRALFSVNGFTTTTTARTNRHGKATLRRLPPNSAINPTVTPPGSTPRSYASITLTPGDSQDLQVSIAPQ